MKEIRPVPWSPCPHCGSNYAESKMVKSKAVIIGVILNSLMLVVFALYCRYVPFFLFVLLLILPVSVFLKIFIIKKTKTRITICHSCGTITPEKKHIAAIVLLFVNVGLNFFIGMGYLLIISLLGRGGP